MTTLDGRAVPYESERNLPPRQTHVHVAVSDKLRLFPAKVIHG